MSAALDRHNLDEWRKETDGATFLGEPISSLSKDELLAALGWAVQEIRRVRSQAERDWSFYRKKPPPPRAARRPGSSGGVSEGS